MQRRGELKLVQQAIRQGWDITPKGRVDAMALVREVLADDQASARERLRACSVALEMEQANLVAEEDAQLLETVRQIGACLELAASARIQKL